jgi:hypothetical protein
LLSRGRFRSVLAVVAMLVLTEAVYLRPEILFGTSSLMGSDYEMLHRWRLAFARESLFGIQHTLPGWNPHELLGAPFAANLQSFPWIPTRLILLLLDPGVAFGAGVALAAALAALFTYLYGRRAGLTQVGAAVAGWTFACAGYFSSRVMAGHLPLLEAYPALPLLLWLVDRALERRRRLDLAVLAVCSACVVAAGHPQVPAYALASAFLYLAWRAREYGFRLCGRVAGAIAFGIGMAGAIWWPMVLLIGRSTRVLHLAAPENDVAMPYGRLLALVVPGIDGWAGPVGLADQNPFSGYPNNSFFWDTASYIGILPLIALAGLLGACIATKRMPQGRWKFLAYLGTGAFLCSLPLATPLLHRLPGTFLRSPARSLYVSTFCVALAMGVAVDVVRRAGWFRRTWAVNGVLALLLAFHFADLWRFANNFIETYPRGDDAPAFQAILDRELGNSRIAEERADVIFSDAERYDDAGGFDSIFLARFNRAYLALAGEPADTNEQVFDASELPVHALEALGIRFVITTQERSDMELAAHTEEANLYRVANPAPRVGFFAPARVVFAEEEKIPEMFAAGPWNRLILTPDAKRFLPGAQDGGASGAAAISYSRPASDEIDLKIVNASPGFVQLVESYDPGWTATVDGAPAPVLSANGFEMAIPVRRGNSDVRLRYETPGRAIGILLSLLSAVSLAGLLASPLAKRAE